jgi:hypothetical protein
MSYENSETDSQPVHQNNEPDGALPALSDSDIEELIRFFQLLARWDREYKLKVVQEGKK